MKHDTGLSVRLETLDGVRIKEYDNGIDDEPHPDFDGLIGTRQIAMKDGILIKVKITVAEFFNLHSADGLWIEICTGYPIGPLDIGESGQCWWIQSHRRSVSGTYEFSFYTNFDDDSNPHIPFTTASTDEGEFHLTAANLSRANMRIATYANASHRWESGHDQALSKASLVVYILRSKWAPSHEPVRTKLQPRHGWQYVHALPDCRSARAD
jgi:hypothetical protein